MSNGNGRPHSILHGRSTDLQVQRIIDVVKTRTYGDVVSYELLEDIVGETRKRGGRFHSVLTRAKRLILKELHIQLKAVVNEGYKLLEPSEQVLEGTRSLGRARRIVRKGAAMAAVADRGQLTAAQAKAADFAATRLIDVADSMRGEERALAHYSHTNTVPLFDRSREVAEAEKG